jgi:hypothetical protein
VPATGYVYDALKSCKFAAGTIADRGLSQRCGGGGRAHRMLTPSTDGERGPRGNSEFLDLCRRLPVWQFSRPRASYERQVVPARGAVLRSPLSRAASAAELDGVRRVVPAVATSSSGGGADGADDDAEGVGMLPAEGPDTPSALAAAIPATGAARPRAARRSLPERIYLHLQAQARRPAHPWQEARTVLTDRGGPAAMLQRGWWTMWQWYVCWTRSPSRDSRGACRSDAPVDTCAAGRELTSCLGWRRAHTVSV